MEWNIDGLSRLIIAAVAAIGLYATFILHTRQASKVRAELLEKFEAAMEKEHKHSATELFHMIHGMPMSYAEIKSLIQKDDCAKIILVLKKRSDAMKFVSGTLLYDSTSPIYMKFVFYAQVALLILVWGATIFFGISIYVTSGVQAVVHGISFLVSSSLFILLEKRFKFDRMVTKLVVEGMEQKLKEFEALETVGELMNKKVDES